MMYSRRKLKPKEILHDFLGFSIIVFVSNLEMVVGVMKGRLMVPPSYTALNGDVQVQLQLFAADTHIFNNVKLQVSLLNDASNDLSRKKLIGQIDVYPDIASNVTQITIPCKYFVRGGVYKLEIVNTGDSEDGGLSNRTDRDERLTQYLDVRWPAARLSIRPESIGTYPPGPVEATLEFPSVECPAMPKVSETLDVPEFWLELLYCGHGAACNSVNISKSQILYAEQIRGFPTNRSVQLRCELFGFAGRYELRLRPILPEPKFKTVMAHIKADWSDQFVFNVHARSIMPCEPHSGGIGVLFEYPACILDQADRVRLFAKLQADVSSLAPPTSLHYITEQRITRGQHSLYFDCDLFSEKYVEYCFVYVSQAISGAVADVRMDCVPTLPVAETDTGGWGKWSEWTACSTTCFAGTRNRYRFCDSPPPKYGSKFCEGPAVETEKCGSSTSGFWECLYGLGSSVAGIVPSDRPEVIAEIGPGCRCGCIVHLGVVKPRRLIASSAQSCPGRTFWLIQADKGYTIRLKIDFFRLPCSKQYLKIRDGDSLVSELLANFYGGSADLPSAVTTTGSQMLLEFFSDELISMGESCGGGFLGHAQQLMFENRIDDTRVSYSKASLATFDQDTVGKLTLVHVAAILFVSIIVVISALLGAQYIFRYHKYQLAESMGEPDSPINTPRGSVGSLLVPSRAQSTTTLISDVISLVKFRPRRHKHSRLRESVDAELLEKGGGVATESDSSTAQKESDFSNPSIEKASNEVSAASSEEKDDSKCTSLTETETEKNSDVSMKDQSFMSNESINISLAQSMTNTPVAFRKHMKVLRKKIDCLDTKSVNGRKTIKLARGPASVCNTEGDTETDTESLNRMDKAQYRMQSVSNTTLTNGCYSPALSHASSAVVRTTNQKESKEKKNREKLLAGPGSEFSLANPEDFEMDYYDYNVINAGAAPGSYLGMDPAFLVWIPPIDEGNIIDEIDDQIDEEPYYDEILPNYDGLDPGSNAETPEDKTPQVPVKPPRKSVNSMDSPKQVDANKTAEEEIVLCLNAKRRELNLSTKTLSCKQDSIPLKEFSNSNKDSENRAIIVATSSLTPHQDMKKAKRCSEKETAVIKSPSDNRLTDFYELSDIQFADDEDDGNDLTPTADDNHTFNAPA